MKNWQRQEGSADFGLFTITYHWHTEKIQVLSHMIKKNEKAFNTVHFFKIHDAISKIKLHYHVYY